MRFLIIFLAFFIQQKSFAEILGVSTKTQLLQQLSLSLKIPVADMKLPPTVVDKLPNSGLVDEVKPSFLTAWTQLTFLGCREAFKLGKIKTTTDKSTAMAWIKSLAHGAWGVEPTSVELEEIYNSSFTAKAKKEQAHTMSCSMVMSSPNVYLKKY